MSETYRVPFINRASRVLFRPVFQGLFRLLGRIKITGEENIPLGKPYVAAVNHVAIFDPILLVTFWREYPEVAAAVDGFEKVGQGIWLSMYGAIPVHRGKYDRALLEKIALVLKSGYPLAIAPEGGRSHVPAMRRAKAGVGYIIEKTQAPVVPVGVVGANDDFLKQALRGEKPPLEMRIGKPIYFSPPSKDAAERRAARQLNADLVMRHIAGLLPEEYHGVYAGQAIA